MQVVDSHIHLWDLEDAPLPLAGKSGRVVRRRRARLKHETICSITCSVKRSDIDVKSPCTLKRITIPPIRVEETRWLQGIADRAESRGMPNAIVAPRADLAVAECARGARSARVVCEHGAAAADSQRAREQIVRLCGSPLHARAAVARELCVAAPSCDVVRSAVVSVANGRGRRSGARACRHAVRCQSCGHVRGPKQRRWLSRVARRPAHARRLQQRVR